MRPNIKKIRKTGNSAVITLDQEFLKLNNLKLGDYVRIDKITKLEFIEVKETYKQKTIPTK